MRRIAFMTVPTVLAAAALSGCGLTTNDAHRAAAKMHRTAVTASYPKLQINKVPALSQRPSGELIIDGSTQGSLSAMAYRDYENQGGSATVTLRHHGENAAFASFCAGAIDIVDSSRPISQAELKSCDAHGIHPVQLQVASDAVVLATKAETDTGADCLTVAQVRDIFRAGSPVTNWSQLGFDGTPLKVAGPGPSNNAFGFFGQYILGQQQPVLLDFRDDYSPEANDRGTRQFVVGNAAQQAAAVNAPIESQQLTSLKQVLSGARITLRGAQKWVMQAQTQITTGLNENWPASQQAANQTKLEAAQTKETAAHAQVARLSRKVAALARKLSSDRKTVRSERSLIGRLGAFRYSYYTLYEQQLRPLEITETAHPENCIFPSQQTITSAAYPFSRQLLLTVSLNALDTNSYLRAFLVSYLQHARALATARAMVPLPLNVLQGEQNWLSGSSTSTTTQQRAATTSTASATRAPAVATNVPPGVH